MLQAKRGLHSNKEVQTPRVNDVSTPGNGQRAKQYLPFLMRAGKLFGTVENVSSGELLARTASRCRTTFLTRL
jgi:staphylococcal nuclease domain-containing protein 1